MNFLSEYLQNQKYVVCLASSFSYTIFSLTLLLKKFYLDETYIAPEKFFKQIFI